MTMDDLVRRLESAASELLRVKAELADHELVLDRSGAAAHELAALLESVWAEHQELGSRLADGLNELSNAVGVAAGNYRATDGERF